MESAHRVQILDEAGFVSIRPNTFGKGMNVLIPLFIDKLKGRLGSLSLVKKLIYEKENGEVKLFKNWPCVTSFL